MGKSVSPPPMPDYAAAAKEQGAENRASARETAVLSNPNMITPYGNQTVKFSDPTFDETRYNADLAKYNQGTNVNRQDFMRTSEGSSSGDTDTTFGGGTYFDETGYENAKKAVGAAPDRNTYMSGGGVPTITQTLNPEAQATFDAQQRVQRALAGLGETGVNAASNILSTPFQPTSTQINKNFADYGRAQGTIANYGRAMEDVPLTTKIDTSNFSNMPLNAGTTAQDLILQRLNPTIEAGDTSFKQSLANQGLAPGTEAYNTAFRNREMSKNDLYNQAALQGINLDMGARQQQVNEALGIGGFENQAQLSRASLYNQALGQDNATEFSRAGLYNQALGQDNLTEFSRAGLYNSALGQDFSQGLSRAQFGNQAQQQQLAQDLTLRGQPINEIIGLMGGSQLQLPQFAGYTPTQIAPTPTFAATQAQNQAAMQNYGIQQAGANATTQGLGSLGLAGAMYFSDRRLKSNIVQVGEHPLGIGIYEYDIFGKRERGVMADEVAQVMPDAIVPHSSGYMMVNYGKL